MVQAETRELEKKAIIFQLGKEEYAVPVKQVGSIERITSITRVPGSKSFVKGVMNLRGVITPLIDLRTRFGMEEKEFTNDTRIIIVQIDQIEVGLIVDSANDVLDIPSSQIEPPPEVIGSINVDYIDGVVKVEDRLLILLNLQKVLTDEEIEEVQRMEE